MLGFAVAKNQPPPTPPARRSLGADIDALEGRALASKSAPEIRRGRVKLALELQEKISNDDIFFWLREVMAGRDPDVPKDAKGNPRSVGLGTSGPLPDWSTRMRAARMLLERRDGMPAQHVHIEQEITASLNVANALVDRNRVAALPAADKALLRDLLRRVTVGEVIPGAMPAAGVRATIQQAKDADVSVVHPADDTSDPDDA